MKIISEGCDFDVKSALNNREILGDIIEDAINRAMAIAREHPRSSCVYAEIRDVKDRPGNYDGIGFIRMRFRNE